jgi:hypothetical protein
MSGLAGGSTLRGDKAWHSPTPKPVLSCTAHELTDAGATGVRLPTQPCPGHAEKPHPKLPARHLSGTLPCPALEARAPPHVYRAHHLRAGQRLQSFLQAPRRTLQQLHAPGKPGRLSTSLHKQRVHRGSGCGG